MEYGHWQCDFEFNSDEWFGFIYRIINIQTNQEYIGKKQFKNTNRKKVKGRKNRKIVKKVSNWMTYTSSSEHVNNDIIKFGKDVFIFIIESLHITKGSLHYAEVEKQVMEDVLRTKMENGERKYYNRNIAAVKFLPPDETSDETRMKRSIALKGKPISEERRLKLLNSNIGRKHTEEQKKEKIKIS